jgi:hypothetical protein
LHPRPALVVAMVNEKFEAVKQQLYPHLVLNPGILIDH